jgi:hypothetical protein
MVPVLASARFDKCYQGKVDVRKVPKRTPQTQELARQEGEAEEATGINTLRPGEQKEASMAREAGRSRTRKSGPARSCGIISGNLCFLPKAVQSPQIVFFGRKT